MVRRVVPLPQEQVQAVAPGLLHREEGHPPLTDPKVLRMLRVQAQRLLLHHEEGHPIIPIIFNQTATLTHKDLSKISYTYYCVPNFKKTKLKNYEAYIPVEEETQPAAK